MCAHTSNQPESTTMEWAFLTRQTRPTREEVLGDLNAGLLPRAHGSFAQQRLVRQFNVLAPRVVRALPEFAAMELDVTLTDVVRGYRLVQLLGDPTAQRITVQVAVSELTRRQGALLLRLRHCRDDLLRLARDRGVAPSLFRVELGDGDASRAITGARVLIGLVKRHADKLAAPKVMELLRAEIDATARDLERSEIAQEKGKIEATQPTTTLVALREALYGLLLKFSRLGPIAVRHDAEAREQFALRILHPTGGGAAGEELEPIAPDDESAPAAELPVAEAPAAELRRAG